MARKQPDKGQRTLRKLGPKLRMVLNGSSEVNAIRAEYASALAVDTAALQQRVPLVRQEGAVPITRDELGGRAGRGRLQRVATDVKANIFIHLANDAKPTRREFPGENPRDGTRPDVWIRPIT